MTQRPVRCWLRLLTSLSLAVVALVAVRVEAQQRPNPIPETFTNLQVLPKDIARQQLVPIMRSFSLNLDIGCEHCHLGEGNDLSKFDFASDDRPAKATARKMLALTRTINESLVQALGEPAAGAGPRVTCYTCHRGTLKPLAGPPGGGSS